MMPSLKTKKSSTRLIDSKKTKSFAKTDSTSSKFLLTSSSFTATQKTSSDKGMNDIIIHSDKTISDRQQQQSGLKLQKQQNLELKQQQKAFDSKEQVSKIQKEPNKLPYGRFCQCDATGITFTDLRELILIKQCRICPACKQKWKSKYHKFDYVFIVVLNMFILFFHFIQTLFLSKKPKQPVI